MHGILKASSLNLLELCGKLIGSILGQGGYGTVYQALDTTSKKRNPKQRLHLLQCFLWNVPYQTFYHSVVSSKTGGDLFEDGLNIRLTDFGLSTKETEATADGAGTRGHLAPECEFLVTSYYPHAADVWALGILIFSLINGTQH
ncbi:hypothetical protein FIBSPDRAFT_924924 [Athelia psychrophila]|uniref:Protein kinase domain-containing protein n=1 Tax=Athelia psychrophila TaxID=1759441 RepID=A0A166VPB9_9AGAM|nr:hypothetical protein FIBSPDRAFT_924924 [Fibularhizoctonia sp. CBS 109695]